MGTPQEIGNPNVDRHTQIYGTVMPSFVNVHAHLDLSGIGVTPPMESFVQWIQEVVFPIRTASNEKTIKAAVDRGVELSIAGGVGIIGDIAGSMIAAEQLVRSALRAVPFVEVFGLGSRQESAIKQIADIPSFMGVQPHAPFSCGEDVYLAAFASGLPVSTHVAETIEEVQCTTDGCGPLVDFTTSIGAWDATAKPWYSHPVDAMIDVAGTSPLLAAHLNYIEDHHLSRLASSNITVEFCPRASTYFGHEGHRWKDMIAAGVAVALGTDSLLCLDTPDRITVLDDMRLLYKRDQCDPKMLFAMATIHGAVGLGLSPSLVMLDEGETAGLLSFDGICNNPLIEILESNIAPQWVLRGAISPKTT